MPTITAGQTFSAYFGAGESVSVQLPFASTGRMEFVPDNDEAPPMISGNSRSMGPNAESRVFGPYALAGTLTLRCDTGSLTYTLVASRHQNMTVETAYTQTAGTFSSTGTGAKTLTASGTGSVVLGATGTGESTLTRVNTLSVISTDSSGTPGAATINNLSGRAAFAAAASTVVITNSKVTAASKVFVSLGSADATLTSVRVTPAAGSFTVTGNAAATGTTVFDFLVVN